MGEGHFTLSPSSSERWCGCPGSVKACSGYPDSSSPAADDGTHTHTALEYQVKEGKSMLPGMQYDDHAGRFRHDADRQERVDFAMNYIESRRAELIEVYGGDVQLKSEEKVNSTEGFGRGDMGGTVDIQLIASDFLEIIDLKDGMGPVGAEGNKQGIIYAICILGKLAATHNITNVRITIVQPKLRFQGQTGIDSWDISAAYLLSLVPWFLERAAATEDPDAPRIPGDSQCKWCDDRGNCQPLIKHVLNESGVDFKAVDLVAEVITVEESITNERLRDIIQVAPLMKSMLEALEQEALRRFQIGRPVVGLKVIRGKGSKSWIPSPEEVAEKLQKMGMKKDTPWKKTILTPNQAKTCVWSKVKGGKEVETKLSAKNIALLDEQYISVKKGSLKVVSENASGEPIVLAEEGMFKPVPEEIELPDFLK